MFFAKCGIWHKPHHEQFFMLTMSRKRVAILSYILAIVLGIGSISIIPFNSTRASEVNYENAVNGHTMSNST